MKAETSIYKKRDMYEDGSGGPFVVAWEGLVEVPNEALAMTM